MIVDVIILSNANTEALYRMTETAVFTCYIYSEKRANITVIEQAGIKSYGDTKILRIDEPFNFNRFANIGASKGVNEWIMIANNDLIFHPLWLEKLLEVNHPVVCPRNPKDFRQQNVKFNKTGYMIGYNFSGWCFMLKRKIWEQIGGFDEDFEFLCADNSFMEQLKAIGIKPMLVKDSIVEHIFKYRKIDEQGKFQVRKFNKKYNQNILGYGKEN